MTANALKSVNWVLRQIGKRNKRLLSYGLRLAKMLASTIPDRPDG